ncbi:hypothetical protein [Jiangella endophytica]|uniref:hypothetical protein n=1 Tax=Jiangella endophytica TaxID=1623398 RepID=UPI000E35075B|nr:hypothetical protein [Jiangella endophytica]
MGGAIALTSGQAMSTIPWQLAAGSWQLAALGLDHAAYRVIVAEGAGGRRVGCVPIASCCVKPGLLGVAVELPGRR